MQPLHIFEPRYREMTRDALASDRLIALVLPRAGSENQDADKPALHEVACLGRIMAEQKLEDGRFNILLRGLARIRIRKELATDTSYRMARCKILQEIPVADSERESFWRETLRESTPSWFPKQKEVAEQFGKLLKDDLSLGTLGDILAFALPLDAEFKQSLLQELNVEARLQVLYDFLEGRKALEAKSQRTFPPEFSVN